jgi:4-hydroxybenzoate polyprenyltransferase
VDGPATGTVDTRAGSLFAAVFDLSRGRQALLSVAQPALGAVLALGGLPSLSKAILGLVAASTGFLAVFSLNDVLDRRVDARALAAGKAEFTGFDLDTAFMRHPLARGDISLKLAVSWVAGLAVVSAVCAYLLNPACLALFGLAVALEVVYCALRSVTWTKTFVSGAMVGVGGLAGWAAVAPLSWAAASIFAFLALWEIAGRNLPNDLSDLVADSRTDIRTVATVFWNDVSARATVIGAVATLASLAFLPMPLIGVAASVAICAWAMIFPAIALVRNPTSDQAGSYFNRASLLPALLLPVAIVVLEAAHL